MVKIADEERVNKNRDYISFSEIHLYDSCPYKHNKNYNLGERDVNNFYSAFGSTLHTAVEEKWKNKNDLAWLRMGKSIHMIADFFADDDGKFPAKDFSNRMTPSQWVKSAFRIYKDFFPWMEENFPGCELYDMEYELFEDVKSFDRKFKGYIDLILYDPKKDIYHIIDLKTSGSGWWGKALTDTKKLYQVILYKHFFCKKEMIDPKKVSCHYVLLLRTPPKKLKHAISLHSVTSGSRKISNALQWMDDTLKLIKMGLKLKTPTTCSFCICGLKPNKFAKKK